ncbi:MAG: transposase [Cyanobacteriota bacterium]
MTGRKPKKEYPKNLRLIKYYDIKTNKAYSFITNNFKLAAKTIADIYKDKWQIELFFKWIKQNLKIKSFLGTTKNAMLIQIWVAMIAYLLISYIKFQANSTFSLLHLTRMIRETLFYRLALFDILTLNLEEIRKIPLIEDTFYQLRLSY